MTSETITAWRAWALDPRGRLLSLHDQRPSGLWNRHPLPPARCLIPDWYHQHPALAPIAARARDTSHRPPEPWCVCGYRAMSTLGSLLDAIEHDPEIVGVRGADIPDVIGTVTLWGRTAPGRLGGDPPGTIRAERAQVGARLHLPRHLAGRAAQVRRWYPKAAVRAGRATGLDWLDEIRETETAAVDQP